MKIRELLTESVTEHTPAFGRDVGVEWVDVDFSATHEEEQTFQKLGISPANLRSVDGLIPVVYSHSLAMKDNDDLMDAIKMRSDTNIMDKRLLANAIDNAIGIALTATMKGKAYAHGNKIKGLEWFQRVVKQPNNVIIVPAPSSSPLSEMIAASLSKATGHPIVRALEKNHFPEISAKVKTRARGYEDRGPVSSPAMKKRAWDGQLKQMTSEMERIEGDPDASDADIDRFYALETKVAEIQDAIKNFHFQKKNQKNPIDMARGIYGYIQPTEHATHLHDKYVVIIDDNIVTSETVAECVKSLMRQGIVPTSIVGYAMHKYH